MANRCYLMSWDAARGKLVRPELESSYVVPVFWLAMFDPDDVHDAALEGEAFVPAPAGPSFLEVRAYASCAGQRALDRLVARTPGILRAVHHDALATKFARFAAQYAGRTVVLQLSEIAMMRPAGEYAARLKASLSRLADPATPAAEVLTLGGLDGAWESSQYAENLLVGWGTGLTVREREEARQKKATAQARRADRQREGLWQTAIDGCPAANRKAYAMSAAYQSNDVIEHPTFGPGVVLRAVDAKKIEVLFADGVHVLACRAAR